MLDELLYVFLRALEFDGDDPLPLITEWNYAIARVQKVFERMTDKDAKLVEVIQNHDFLESLMKPDWIPVTDRLPEKSGNYLTAFEDRTAMAVNEFMHQRDWLTEEGREAHPNGKWYWGGVTHWMELPEPPKEEITRCKDCEHWMPDGENVMVCTGPMAYSKTDEAWYCASAKRR